jgi:penicillin-binding protein 1A
MGGKTGTTNDNADAWFIGYTPQILTGSWVGFDDQFIRNEGDGSRMARPICEYFLQKVLSDHKTGIEREARFVVPADMTPITNSADILMDDAGDAGANDAQNLGNGSESDYQTGGGEYIGPESTPVIEETNKAQSTKKDTSKPAPKKEAENAKPIGAPRDEPKKKGVLNRIFK